MTRECPDAILRATLAEGGSVELDVPHPGKQGKDLSCSVRTGKSFSKFFGKFPQETFHKLGTPQESEEILEYIDRKEPRKTGSPVQRQLHKTGISISKVGKSLGFGVGNKVSNPTPDQIGRSLQRGAPAALIVERAGTPRDGSDREKGLHVLGVKGYQKKGKHCSLTVNDSLSSQAEKVPYEKGKPLSLASGDYRPTQVWDSYKGENDD